MSVGAVLVAAGSGARLGHEQPKAFVPVGGVPLLVHAARALVADHGAGPAQLVVVVPPGLVARAGELLAGHCPVGVDLWVVEGAGTRQGSVAAGLAALVPQVDLVLVHDAARAFAPPSLARRVVEAVRAGHVAVVPGLPLIDTVKQVGPTGTDGTRTVLATPARSGLVAVQTPQGFDRAVLDRAHAAAADRAGDAASAASDDAGLVEALGLPVAVVAGDEAATKITTAADLAQVRRREEVR